MFDIREAESSLEVRYRCVTLPLLLLLIPPGMLYEQGGSLLEGSLSAGETIGVLLGIIIPFIIVGYYVEIAEFSFNRKENSFDWRWRNLFRRDGCRIPLNRVTRIHREDLDAHDLTGMQTRYRLQVILDDGDSVALTRGFSGFHGHKLNKIVNQVRDYLGHVTPMA